MILLYVDVVGTNGDRGDAVVVGMASLRETALFKAMQRATGLTFYHSLKGF